MGRKLILFALLIAFAALADDAKPNFSGTWKLNLTKSQLGPMAPDSRTDVIDHKDPAIRESVNSSSSQGDFQMETAYTTDGKEAKNTIMGSDFTTKAHWEGNALIVDTKGTTDNGDVTIHGKYELSDDGKTLTKSDHISGGFGEADEKLVFDKQ